MGIDSVVDETVSLKVLVKTIQRLLQADSGVFTVRPTVLVVDDQKEVCELEAAVLSRKGYKVRTVANGDEAIEAVVQDQSIGVVLLDIKMSGKDGLAVLKEINSMMNPPQAIIVTGLNDETVAAQARKFGAFDYILKPIDPEKLESVVIACLSHAAYSEKSLWQRFTSFP